MSLRLQTFSVKYYIIVHSSVLDKTKLISLRFIGNRKIR